MKEKVMKFLEGLSELSNKTGITVHGCGCCGSPFLDELEKGQEVKEYTIANNGDEYEYLKAQITENKS